MSVLSLGVLKYVVGDVMDVMFSVSIVKRVAACARIWEVRVFRHANVVYLRHVCILWLSSMLRSA